MHHAAITSTPNGDLILSDNIVRGLEVRSDCSLGSISSIDAGPKDSLIVAAIGSASYGVAWYDGSTNVPRRQLFGSRFCN